MYKNIIFLLILSIVPLSAQFGLSDQTIWAIGANDTILQSYDNGTTWTAQTSSTSGVKLNDVHFTGTADIWVAGDGGNIVYTDNGGTSWVNQGVAVTTENLNGIFFADDGAVYAQDGWAVGNNDTILTTNDKGVTWAAMVAAPPTTGVHFQDAYFLDADSKQTGWVVGGNGTTLGYIIKATGAGGTLKWTWGTPMTFGTTTSFNDVQFVDANTGWVVGNGGVIYKTINGGTLATDWALQTSGTVQNILGVSFANATNGWAVTDQGTILATIDGGTNWTVQVAGTGPALNAVRALDNAAKNVWAVGDGGQITFTNDGGTTWTAQTSGTSNNLLGIFVRAGLDTNSSSTTWKAIKYSHMTFPDFINDEQASAPGADFVGRIDDPGTPGTDESVPAFYTKFWTDDPNNPRDGEFAFRFRFGTVDNTSPSFSGLGIIGIDLFEDANADIDLFIGIGGNNNPALMEVNIWNSDPGKTNTGPSTSGLITPPIYTMVANDQFISYELSGEVDPSIPAADKDLDNDSKPDYFLTFKIPFIDIINALEALPDFAVGSVTDATPMRYAAVTSTNKQGFNQDLNGSNGMGVEYKNGGFGDPLTPTGNVPTAVKLVFFKALRQKDHVTLKWETATETDNLGFHLWRRKGLVGTFSRITGFIIPGQGGPSWGSNYSYNDFTVDPETIYQYKLQDIDLKGQSTFHGPVLVKPVK